MMQVPNVHEAEPIPAAARDAIDALLRSGDLFRYTAPQDAPVSLLESEFAALLGSKYALAVSSCSAALFLSLKALGLPRDARVLIPGFTFAAVPSSVVHADCVPVLCEVGDNYRVDLADFEERSRGCLRCDAGPRACFCSARSNAGCGVGGLGPLAGNWCLIGCSSIRHGTNPRSMDR